jgi:hypothetical protein
MEGDLVGHGHGRTDGEQLVSEGSWKFPEE